MRVFAIVLAAVALSLNAFDAAAQPGAQPGSGGRPGSNTNSLSTGSNRNTNANSNSQFLSGNNTGVNNGLLEIYSGSEPYQGIVLEGSTSLPQLPVIPAPPSNFSQPYRPETFVNMPPFLPTDMTLVDAKRCRDAKASWYGQSGGDDASSIRLIYAPKPEAPRPAVRMADYVGTAVATTADGPFLAALCEAAYRAMRKGATVGMVEFAIRPKNTMFGVGFGASGGATGLPAAGAHPYAIAGTLGFGTGWSNQRVEGEVIIQLTALRGAATSSTTDPGASSPASSPSTAAPVSEAAPASNENAAPASETPVPSTEKSAPVSEAPAPASGPVSAPVSEVPSSKGRLEQRSEDQHPAAAPRFIRTASRPGDIVTAHAPSGASALSLSGRRTKASPAATAPNTEGVAYHSPGRLAGIKKGHSKARVFEAFATAFVERDGKIVEVQGMRLRASGRSRTDRRMEVGEVFLGERDERKTPYWFLFEDDRLIAWGRPEQWGAAAKAHAIDVPYHPASSTLPFEVKVDLGSGR